MKEIVKALTSKDRKRIALCLVLMIIGTAFSMKAPEYSKIISSQIASGKATMEMVRQNSWIVFALNIASVVCSIFIALLFAKISASFGASLRALIFDKVCRIGNDDVNRITVGSLLTRSNNDISMMQLILLSFLQLGIQAPMTAVWAIIKIRHTNMGWTGAVVLCVIVLLALIATVVYLVYPKFLHLRECDDALNTAFRQTMSGVRVIRAFNIDAFQTAKNDYVNKDLQQTSFSSNRLVNILSPAVDICHNALSIAIYLIGTSLMLRVSFSGRAIIMGNMTAFSQYSLMIISAFTSMVGIFVLLPEVLISVKRLKELFDCKDAANEITAEIAFGDEASLKINNISFSFGNETDCLKDISFNIKAGDVFAITGPTGCGKTSLLYLIRRILKPYRGSILINGIDINLYPEEKLNEIISFTPQRALLFAESLSFNVAYSESFDENRMKAVLDYSAVDFTDENGIDMKIEQGGLNLSGGQRQRVCIARGLYKKSEIYIFDDSFSALDTKTERDILTAIRDNYKDSIIILVSQRVSTLKAADRIAVLEDGRITALGSHSELISKSSYYKELIRSQAEEVLI